MATPIRVQIARVKKGLVEGISELVGQAAFSAFSSIVIASPVDTGHFRNNWQVGINERPSGIREGGSSSAGEVIGRVKVIFDTYELGSRVGSNKIIFTNNVAYATRLNEGHSMQAKSGFVEKGLRAGLKNLGASGKIFNARGRRRG